MSNAAASSPAQMPVAARFSRFSMLGIVRLLQPPAQGIWILRWPGYRRDNSPVTASMRASSAGPIAQQVRVPAATWVRPASWMSATGSPAARAASGRTHSSQLLPQHQMERCGELAVGGDDQVLVVLPGEPLGLALAAAVHQQLAKQVRAVPGPVTGHRGDADPPAGRAPHGAQVRPFGGLSPCPVSSSKQT
jgi:hypothetical protein